MDHLNPNPGLKNDIGRFHITYVEWRGISKKEVGGSGWKVEKQQESGVAGEDGRLARRIKKGSNRRKRDKVRTERWRGGMPPCGSIDREIST